MKKKLRIPRLKVWLIALAILVPLVWPHRTSPKPLGPRDLGLALAGPLAPAGDAKHAVGKPRYKLSLAPDERIFNNRFGYKSLLGKLPEVPLEKRELLTRVIALPLATYGRTNHCHLTLQLGTQKSAPIACEALTDFGYAVFQFHDPVLPGQYEAEIYTDNDDPNHQIAVLAAPGKTPGELWLLPDAPPAWMTSFAALVRIFPTHPSKVLGVVLGFSIMLAAIFLGSGAWPSFAAFVFGLLLSVHAMAWQFSGHDETAHVDMLHTALQPTQTKAKKAAFYQDAAQLLVDSHFYRLHVSQFAGSNCPHSVLNSRSCGHSPSPLWLYSWYAKVLPETDQAADIALFGRLINAALLVGALVVIGALFGAPAVTASLASLCFAGFVWAQSASVTNDFPMSIYGLLFGSLVGALIVETTRKARFAMGILLLALLPIAAQIDRSWVSILLAWPVILVAFLASSRLASGISRHWWAYGLVFGGAAALVFVAFWLMPWLAGPWKSYLPEDLKAFVETTLTPEEFMVAISTTKITIKSLFGSFLWGHAYYPFGVNLALVGAVAFASLTILLRASSLRARLRAFGLFATHGASLMLVVVGMVMIGRYFKPFNIPSDQWAKPRFLAGIWLLVLLPIWKLAFDAYENEQLRTIIFRTIALGAMVIGMIVLPRMFLIEIF